MDATLDTSIVIELFRGNKKVLEALPKDLICGISVITLFELYCGSLKEREEIFLEKIPKLNFDEKSAKLAGKIYRELRKEGRVPKVKDPLISSSAIAHDKLLITTDRDSEVFRRFGLNLKIV